MGEVWETLRWTYSPSLVTVSSPKLWLLDFVSAKELRTDRQTDKQTDGRTDDPITRCPRRTFQAGGIKICGLLILTLCHGNILECHRKHIFWPSQQQNLAHLSIHVTGSMQALVSNSCRLVARCCQTVGSQGRCTCTCNGKEIKYIFRHKAPVRAGSAHIDNIYNPSCPWHECPGAGQILELSRHYISIQMYAM